MEYTEINMSKCNTSSIYVINVVLEDCVYWFYESNPALSVLRKLI